MKQLLDVAEQLASRGEFPNNAVVLSTIVSGDMMKEIARSYDAEVDAIASDSTWWVG